jgi:alkylation response protein AidB-like acyl-CoA dehydrogenase
MIPIYKNIVEKYAPYGTAMDHALWKNVQEFVEKEIMPVREDLDDKEKAPELCEKIARGVLIDMGFQVAAIPVEYGGLGITSWVTSGPIVEELARGDVGLCGAIARTMLWPVMVNVLANNKAIWEEILCPILKQDKPVTSCSCITQHVGGCNIESYDARGRAIRVIAKENGGDYVINGKYIWPSGAGVADFYFLITSTDPEKGADGVALFFIPADTKGLSFGKPEELMGQKYTDVNAEVFLDNVRVPKRWRVAGPGEDWKLMQMFIALGRWGTAPFAIGGAQACLEIAIEHTGRRYYAGKKVRDHSLQAAMLGEMALEIEAARHYYMNIGQMAADTEKYGDWGSIEFVSRCSGAKYFACEVGNKIPNMTMQLMGSLGYAKSSLVEKYLRDIKICQLWLAGAEIARIDVARGYYDMPPYEKIEPLVE